MTLLSQSTVYTCIESVASCWHVLDHVAMKSYLNISWLKVISGIILTFEIRREYLQRYRLKVIWSIGNAGSSPYSKNK